MPLPVFVASQTNQSTAGTDTPTVAVPAGAQNGDRLIALLVYANNATATSPSGWTEHTNTLLNSVGRVVVCSRVMSTGVTQAQWTLPPGSPSYAKSSMAMVAYRGEAALTYGTPVVRSASATTTVAPSITTAGANSMVLGLFGERVSSQTSATVPTGMTERAKLVQGGGGGTTVMFAEEARATAGATGTRTATYGVASDNGFGVLIELTAAGTTAPVVNAGADATSNVSATFSRTATWTGTAVSNTWTRQSGPANPTITGASTATMSVTPTVPGTYVYRHTVSDGTTSGFDEFTLYVAGTTVRPDGTVTNPGNWVPVGGSATVYEAEADESDTTMTETPDAAVGAAYTVTLSPLQPGPVTVTTRGRISSGSAVLRQELLQGSTVIATWDDTLTTSHANYSHTTTTTQTTSITNFNDLRLRRTWLS